MFHLSVAKEFEHRRDLVRAASTTAATTPATRDCHHEIEIATPPSGDVREVEFADTGYCAHCHSRDAAWLFWIARYLCDLCRDLPVYRTICRSAVMRQYGLSLDQLLQSQEDGLLQVFYCDNPHNTGKNAGKDNKSTYMKLYFVHEVQALVLDLQRQKRGE